MSAAGLFEKHEQEYTKFSNIERINSKRPDMHAFIMLDELFPTQINGDIIANASHDGFYLNIQSDDIEKLTSDQVLELIRCGVLYCCENDALYMLT